MTKCSSGAYDFDAPLADRVARRLGEVLPAFMKVLRQRIAQAGLPDGLTLPQILVLRTIESTGEVLPSELARHFLLSAASVTALVDSLVQKGLVDRRHADQDRRTIRLRLTPAGEEVVAAAGTVMVGTIHQIVADLPEASLHRLLAALDDLDTLTSQHREGDRRYGCVPRPPSRA